MLITPIQTRWNDLDSFAHVNNSYFVSYLEIGRVDYCARRLGVRGIYEVPFLLARIEIDLLKPIELLDEVEVLTCVSKIGNKSWQFQAIVRNRQTQTHFAKANTVQVSFDHRAKISIPIPEQVRRILEEDLAKFNNASL